MENINYKEKDINFLNLEHNTPLEARNFAIEVHGDQKYGNHPYVFHLDAVANIVINYGEIAMIIAYLHDVLEDTVTTKATIENKFGKFVANCVELITDEAGYNRKERKAKTYKKIKKANNKYNVALVVKTADRLANILSCSIKNKSLLKMYLQEQSDFKTAVYRDNLCDRLWQRIDDILN